MTKIKPNSEPLTAFMREKAGLSNAGAHLETIPAGIQDHVKFFVDVVESRKQGKAVVTVASTVEGLRALGCDSSFTATLGLGGIGRNTVGVGDFGGFALTGLFAQRQGNGFGGNVEVDKLREVGVRDTRDGINADTGSFRKADGTVDVDKATQFCKETAARTPGKGGKPKDFITLADIKAYLGDTSYPGKIVNELELRLAFELFAQTANATDQTEKGERIFTAAHWVAFLDGTAWEGLAKARDTHTLYMPVGEPKHDAGKKIAARLAKQTGAMGGLHADAGTRALYGAANLIDTDASLKAQDSMKNLGKTLGGALLLLCPFKGMMAAMTAKPAENATVS